MRGRLVPLLLLAVGLCLPSEARELCAQEPAQDRRDALEPGLRRAGAPQRVLLRLARGAKTPAIPGLSAGSRIGDIVSATATPAALAAMAAHADVARVEAARPMHLCNDVGHASTIGFRGTISAAAEVDSYSFAATAGQTCRLSVRAESALDAFLSVTDGAPVTDDNSGPGSDAEITITWTSSGLKTIDVSGVGVTTGEYLLVITCSAAIVPAMLTFGDIGVATPHFAGTRAREARTVEGVDGSTVVVGVIDTGIDFTHQDFRDGAGNTRVLAIWDQTLTPIAGEASPDVAADGSTSNDYGVAYTESHINSTLSGTTPGLVRQQDTDGHGSHVAGIAAGDGSSSAAGFVGAAPGAKLIVVKFNGSSSDIVDAIDFIHRQAASLGYTATVINLSLGTHDGPHDGTSTLDAAVDAASTRGHYIVASAGNEAATLIHAQQTIATTYTFSFTPTIAINSSSTSSPHVCDFWAPGSDTYSVTVTDPSFGDTATATSGSTGTVGPTLFLQAITIDNKTDSPSNGATHIRVSINNALPAVAWTIAFTRTASAGSGVVDGYVGTPTGTFDVADCPTNPDASLSGTVGEPATAKRAFAVAAYRGKFSWDNVTPGTTIKSDGIGVGVAGGLASFSSRGPTRDGRQKPDIAAPGAYIASARSVYAAYASADADADGVHAYLQGTSMAAPHVAGLLALLLQKNKLIDPDSVKATLAAGALTDILVTPGNGWGAGKVDALSLLASVPWQVDVEANAASCANGAGAAPGAFAWFALCLILMLRWRR